MSKLAATLLSSWLLVLPSASGLIKIKTFATEAECHAGAAFAFTHVQKQQSDFYNKLTPQYRVVDSAEVKRSRCIPDGATLEALSAEAGLAGDQMISFVGMGADGCHVQVIEHWKPTQPDNATVNRVKAVMKMHGANQPVHVEPGALGKLR